MQLPRFPVSGIPAQQRIDKLRGQLELAVTDGEAKHFFTSIIFI